MNGSKTFEERCFGRTGLNIGELPVEYRKDGDVLCEHIFVADEPSGRYVVGVGDPEVDPDGEETWAEFALVILTPLNGIACPPAPVGYPHLSRPWCRELVVKMAAKALGAATNGPTKYVSLGGIVVGTHFAADEPLPSPHGVEAIIERPHVGGQRRMFAVFPEEGYAIIVPN